MPRLPGPRRISGNPGGICPSWSRRKDVRGIQPNDSHATRHKARLIRACGRVWCPVTSTRQKSGDFNRCLILLFDSVNVLCIFECCTDCKDTATTINASSSSFHCTSKVVAALSTAPENVLCLRFGHFISNDCRRRFEGSCKDCWPRYGSEITRGFSFQASC